jgi:hypothetical protein
MSSGVYVTPLGSVPVDEGLSKKILAAGKKRGTGILFDSLKGHFLKGDTDVVREHALEVQLPFLQTVLSRFSLVPIIIGDQRPHVVNELGSILGAALKGCNVLLVASTDLSHFYPYEKAKKLDRSFIHAFERFDWKRVNELGFSGTSRVCGWGAVSAVMQACRLIGADRCSLLTYYNSGDVPAYGDTRRVVGYMAGAILDIPGSKDGTSTGVSPSESKIYEGRESPMKEKEHIDLNDSDKRYLLKCARSSIAHKLEGNRFSCEEPSKDSILREKRGAFVTLTKNGQLRGCIGYIKAFKPLYVAVEEMAISAGFNDPRFPPLDASELDSLDIEISVLSPLHPVKDADEIEVGKHGIIIKKGFQQGLLLPQVATEYGWDRETFLQHTCRKAGLGPNEWKSPDAEIVVFSAQIFNEKDMESP